MGWLRNRKLRKIKEIFIGEYKMYLASSRWAPQLSQLVKSHSQAWGPSDEPFRVLRQVLKMDNPLDCFEKSPARVQRLNETEQNLLRNMIVHDLSKNGTDSIEKYAYSLPALIGIAPRGLISHFKTTPDQVLEQYDGFCRPKR